MNPNDLRTCIICRREMSYLQGNSYLSHFICADDIRAVMNNHVRKLLKEHQHHEPDPHQPVPIPPRPPYE